MPRSDPPPTKKTESLEMANKTPLGSPRRGKSSPPSEDIELGDMMGDVEVTLDEPEIASSPAERNDVEITTGEADISLADLDLDEGDDPCPSPFERVTVAPDVSEREYVARMMGEAPLSEPVPPFRSRAPAPAKPGTPSDDPGAAARASLSPSVSQRPLSIEPSLAAISSWPAPADPAGPLTLDLVDSPPPPGGATESVSPSIPLPPGMPGEATTGIRAHVPLASEPVAALDEPDAVEPRAPNGTPLSFGPTSGDALELVGVRAQSIKPPKSPSITMRAVRDRFDVGDFSGALVLAEGILEHDPESVDALLYAEHCRDVLKQMYISRLGGVGRVPQVAVSHEQLPWLSLDHRAGFLLSLVDGRSSFEEVLDMSGMPPIEALRLLLELLQQNVIKVG
jgi:hypothetical protein